MIPSKIGPYVILADLRPGLRPLYRAKGPDGRIVALKTTSTDGIGVDVRERFKREASICAAFDHPNLVRIFDSGEADGVLYLAMECLEGGDLRQVIAENRAPTWEEKFSIMDQVCDGLAFAHSQNLVHRDLKPANLFLENSGRVRILDFGMARVESSNLTRVGMAVGTLLYMAPEQARGEPTTAATDIFAAGMVFYELATGKHPFAAGERDVAKILKAIVFGDPPPLASLVPDAPDGLDMVVARALQKDPTKRLHTASDLKRALSLCAIGIKSASVAVAGEPGAPGPGGAAPHDPLKTVVMPRPAPSAVPPRREPVKTPAPAGVSSTLAKRPDAVFCTACTHANAKGAVVCEKCGLPLAARRGATAAPSGITLSRGTLWVIGSLLLVAILVLFAWISKSR